MWELRADDMRVSALEELPKDIGKWTKYELLKDAPVLAFQVSSDGKKGAAIMVDTGDSGGIRLSEGLWKTWRQHHADKPATLEALWTPASGMTVHEECWADKFSLGSFSVTNVPIEPSSFVGRGIWDDYQASMGLFALTRQDVILDWKNGSMYLGPTQPAQRPYSYNRIGAVFVPGGNKGNDLVGHVLDPSPAYEAGIRNGDILLKTGDLDVTQWHTDPSIRPQKRFYTDPAGTRIHLTLQRDGKPFETTVELRDILQPEPKSQGASRPVTSSPGAGS
jgi:hypothetical protein